MVQLGSIPVRAPIVVLGGIRRVVVCSFNCKMVRVQQSHVVQMQNTTHDLAAADILLL